MPQLTLGAYLARVVVPVLGVALSVMLLVAAAGALVMNVGTDAFRHALFAAGVLSWMAGIGWGVVVNAKPLRAPQRAPHEDA